MGYRAALPPIVRCNRGLGAWFWYAITVVVVISGALAYGRGQVSRDDGIAALAIGGVAVLIIVLVWVFLPRLSINVADGTVRTRYRTVAIRDLSAVHFLPHQRGGFWVRLFDSNGRRVTQMALWGSLFTQAKLQEWVALRHVIVVAASRPVSAFDHILPARSQERSVADVVQTIDAHIAWCLAGNKPTSLKSPGSSLARAFASFS